ncbi:C4-type zinc ribbon domain-containing protein [Schumannella luteola]|uniref:CT398-like coiled coil hairpin domain-containing protein n=1 Tax=Schumannella luteola TaxID=472059 RepID=A0A852YDG4_9MICO|nr:hypothetical protein [Schumannella luteola]NYG99842.1 hypothetical protein [Schumannella luteola]TPX02223.1 hypothetical protein FJ656_23540 [Schumannella luteola]
MKAAPADQALLLELQELDTRIHRVSIQLAKLPEQEELRAIAEGRDVLRQELAQKNGSLEDAQTELKRTEADVAVVDARIARDGDRLQASTSVKDIQGLEQELAALQKRKSDLEDIELAVMETIEERTAEVEKTRAGLADLEQRAADAQSRLSAAQDKLSSDGVAAETARGGLLPRIPADLLALYEKQRARYGIGASLLQRGVSVAAGVALNASDLTVVRAAAPDDVLLCPESQAILVRTDDSGL